jgi:ribosome-associated protein
LSLASASTKKSKVIEPTSVAEQQLNDLIIDSIQDIKGKNIVKLDLRHLDAPANFFIICEGDSFVQVRAIAENINKRLKNEAGIFPNHIEGKQQALWVLADYFTTVVHVFTSEHRHFYQLEDLWSDAKVTEYKNV